MSSAADHDPSPDDKGGAAPADGSTGHGLNRPRQRFSRLVGMQVVGQIVALMVGMVSAVVVARALQPRGRGAFSVAQLIALILEVVFGVGVSYANTYLGGSKALSQRRLLRTTSTIVLGTTLVAVAVAIVARTNNSLSAAFHHAPSDALALAALTVPVLVLRDGFTGLLQAQERFAAMTAASAGAATLQLLLTVVLLVLLGLGVVAAVFATAVGAAIAAAWSAWLLHIRPRELVPTRDGKDLRRVLSYGLQSSSADTLQFLTLRLDALLLASLGGLVPAGLYAVSTRLAELIWVVPNAMSAAIIARASRSSTSELNAFTPRVFTAAAALSLVAGAVLAASAEWLIPFVFGDAYAGAVQPLLWLLPGVVCMGPAAVLANELAGRGVPRVNVASSAAGLAITVVLDVILIPRLHATGAAVASSAAYISVTVLVIAFYRRITGGQILDLGVMRGLSSPHTAIKHLRGYRGRTRT